MNPLQKMLEPWIVAGLLVAVTTTVLFAACVASVHYPKTPAPPETE